MSTEQKPIGWVRYNRGGRSGVFNTGAECPPGWVGAAFPVYESAAPAAQPEHQYRTDYNVWQCRIYVRKEVDLPSGFDAPPRAAAERALQGAGVLYAACFSGWGNAPIENELAVIENRLPAAERHHDIKEQP